MSASEPAEVELQDLVRNVTPGLPNDLPFVEIPAEYFEKRCNGYHSAPPLTKVPKVERKRERINRSIGKPLFSKEEDDLVSLKSVFDDTRTSISEWIDEEDVQTEEGSCCTMKFVFVLLVFLFISILFAMLVSCTKYSAV